MFDRGALSVSGVAAVGFEPTTSRLCVPLQLSLPDRVGLWSGLSLHLSAEAGKMPAVKSLHLLQLGAEAWLGITISKASPNLTGDHTRVSSDAALCKILVRSFSF